MLPTVSADQILRLAQRDAAHREVCSVAAPDHLRASVFDSTELQAANATSRMLQDQSDLVNQFRAPMAIGVPVDVKGWSYDDDQIIEHYRDFDDEEIDDHADEYFERELPGYNWNDTLPDDENSYQAEKMLAGEEGRRMDRMINALDPVTGHMTLVKYPTGARVVRAPCAQKTVSLSH